MFSAPWSRLREVVRASAAARLSPALPALVDARRVGRRAVTAVGTAAVIVLPLCFIACSGGGDSTGTTPVVTTASILEGDATTSVAGDAVSVLPAVKVSAGTGGVLKSVAVAFTVTGGGGTATGTSALSDANGIARVGGWTLGVTAGANTMSASVQGVSSPLVFTATGRAGAATTLAKAAGDAQTAVVATAVPVRPSVRVADKNGNAVAGASVAFAPGAGSGTVTAATVSTGGDGVATVGGWTLGTGAAAQTLTATAAGISAPVLFSATALAGPAATVSRVAGEAQTATVATVVSVAPSVKVTDAFGNPLNGVSVAFTIASGGGVLSGANTQTNASGVATVGAWTLGAQAGAQSVAASVSGVATPATFTATAVAGAPAQVLKQGGDAQTATVATAVPVAPSVRVNDQYGNPVAGIAVTFGGASAGGALTGASTQTNASGVATVGSWLLGTAAGAQSMSAGAAGISGGVTFSATATPGPAALLTKTAGDLQTGGINALLPINPAIRLSDQFGNVISLRTVTFAVASGGGSVLGASVLTGANGTATVGGWTLGSAAGTQTLQASADALSVIFTATATALLNVAQYVGAYSGTWVNTTFSSTGTGSVTIANDANSRTATVTASATGAVLGTPGGVAATTRNSVYGTSSGSFTGVVAPMGTVNGSIDAAGNIVASGTNVPNVSISRWDAQGTITASQVRLTFTVTFTAGPPAFGSITLNKQ